MAFMNDEALLVFATIKELEASGRNVDHIRRIGAGVLERFGMTEAEVDAVLELIKAGAPYPLPTAVAPVEPTPEPVPEEPAPEPTPEEPPVEEPIPEEPPVEEPLP